MGHIKWYFVPEAIVFVTLVTEDRNPLFSDQIAIRIFKDTLERVQPHHPFELLAYVILPDHVHLLIRPPKGERNFASIIHSIKRNFTLNWKRESGIEGELHAWQRGYWDRIIRDEPDFYRYVDYIYWNPVKHGFVDLPEEWGGSSYAKWHQGERGGTETDPAGTNELR